VPTYNANVWFGNDSGGKDSGWFKIEASTLVSAVGKAVREGRKKVRGKFSVVTVNVERAD
jgi:hypothetical protein